MHVCIYVLLQIMYPTVVGMKTDLSGVLTVCTYLAVIIIISTIISVITLILSLSFCQYLCCLYIIYHYQLPILLLSL